jgi:hypothetical protein
MRLIQSPTFIPDPANDLRIIGDVAHFQTQRFFVRHFLLGVSNDERQHGELDGIVMLFRAFSIDAFSSHTKCVGSIPNPFEESVTVRKTKPIWLRANEGSLLRLCN